MEKIWAEVDDYLGNLLAPHDPALTRALDANQASGLPSIDVPPLLGKFLDVIIRISGARRVLELGTLGGYSTIWMARALPPDGQLISLEIESKHADIARANLEAAGVMERVDIRVGPAIESLRALLAAGAEPFDLIFLDADKQSLPEYLEWSLKLSRPGTVIIADNVVRDGKVVNSKTDDPHVRGVQRYLELAAKEPRLSTTAMPTVGARGYDGFSISVVLK
ncbi:O-methyltransferase [Occallatibacter riparius]|uniref:O-methyltransferase n=1 Tax=Occallatibacter riparius TaxID=1002689 RepID=A0A9J7BGN7_9BACT|nr:O-methyltransferase [Occallatibacter riparius]UWZ82140.1 O-methyltransferase [Occallatibacter riparius]